MFCSGDTISKSSPAYASTGSEFCGLVISLFRQTPYMYLPVGLGVLFFDLNKDVLKTFMKPTGALGLDV
jgi:hypothetical protein